MENPYDKAFIEEFRQFYKEKHPERYEEYQQYQNMGQRKDMPVNEDTIKNAPNYSEKKEGEPVQTEFNRDYFKK